MRLDKCNAYTAKEILGYRGRKTDRDRIRNKSTDKLQDPLNKEKRLTHEKAQLRK